MRYILPFLNAAVLVLGLVFSPASASAQLPDNLTLNVTVDGNARTLVLYKRSPRPVDFELRFWTNANGYELATTNQYPPARTYRGTVTEEPNTIVMAYVKKDETLDVAAFRGVNQEWSLSNFDVAAQIPSSRRARGSRPAARPAPTEPLIPEIKPGECVVLPGPDEFGEFFGSPLARAVHTPAPQMPPINGVQRLEYAVDLNHYKIATSFGGDWEEALLWLDHYFNIFDHWHTRDAMVQMDLAHVVVRIDEFYTTDKFAPNSFGQFGILRDEWKGPLLNTPWDAVHMFKTANGYPPGVGGFALGNQIGKDESPWSTDALFHENGHNWSLGHLPYNKDNMGGNRPSHGPFSIDRVLAKRESEILEGTFDSVAAYTDPVHPYAHVDMASTPLNTAVDVNVLANDWDANGESLSIRSFTISTIGGGTVTDQGGGVLRYTPATGFVGKDIVVYEVQDTAGFYNDDMIHIEVVDGGLAAHFELEESTGATAVDATGNGHVGQLRSGTFAEGTTQGVVGQGVRPPGSGFIFDNRSVMPVPLTWGSNFAPFDTEAMSVSNGFDPMDADYTIAFWFKPDTLSGSRELVSKTWATSGGQNLGYYIKLESGKISAVFRHFLGSSGTKTVTWDESSFEAGSWYHLAFVLDRTAETANIFVNGVPGDNPVALDPGVFIFHGRYPLILGPNANGMTAFDDARVYTKALSQTEINALVALAVFPASQPIPGIGAINVATNGTTLSWTEGGATYDHDVYFGTDPSAVAAATTASPEYQGRQSAESWPTGALNPSTTYYWRIDEATPADGIVKGDVWNFNTVTDPGETFTDQQGWWRFEEGFGTEVLDSSSAGNNGSFVNNPTRASSGVAGNYVCFDGVEDYINLGTAPSVTGTSDLTIAGWIKIDDAGTRSHMIAQQRNGYWSNYWRLWVDSDGVVNFQIRDGNTTEVRIQADSITVDDGTWHHVAGVRNGNTSYVYIDGQLANFASRSNTVNLETLPVSIGGAPDDNNNYFDGCIDEVRLWGRALNPGEVDSLSASGRPVTLEYWHDISGNSVGNLTGDPDYPNNPSFSTTSSSLSTTPDYGSSFGARARALFVAPATGAYQFWIASDDHSELLLSTDATEANANVIASVSGYTGVQNWFKYPSQQSQAIGLVAGQRYYIEALLKEGGGSDHMNVAWSGPGQSRILLSVPYLEPLGASTSNEAPEFIFDPIHAADGLLGTAYAGSLTGLAVDPNPADTLQFAKLSGPSWLIVSANGSYSGTPDAASSGTNTFTVRVSDNGGLTDTATLHIVINENAIIGDYWYNISGSSLSALTGLPSYPDSPDSRQYFINGYDAPQNIGGNYGLRTRAVLCPPTTGAYRFWISSDDEGTLLLGTDDTPEYATEIASVPGYSSYQQFNKYGQQQSAYTNLVGGQRYYIEASFKEGGGADHLTVAWEGPGISQQVIPAANLKIYIENTPPVYTSDPVTLTTAEEDQPYSANLASRISDPDVLDTHTFEKISGPAWMSVAANGSITGTPTAADNGLNVFVVKVGDNRHGSSLGTIHIDVQHSPAAYNSWASGHGVSGGAFGDDDGDGWSNIAEFLGNTDPKADASKISLLDVTEPTTGQPRIRWNSPQDGGGDPRSYDVYVADSPYSPSASWTRLAGPIAQAGAVTEYIDTTAPSISPLRLYHVMPAGYVGGPAENLLGVQRVSLLENEQNFVAFALEMSVMTLAALFPPDQLPGGATESAATCIDLWDAGSQSFATRYWLSTDGSFPGWRESGGFNDANNVVVDPTLGLCIILRAGAGAQTIYLEGTVPATASQNHAIAQHYNLLSSAYPANISLQSSGLVAAGFEGSSRFFQSDMVVLFNPATREWDSLHWFNSADGNWYDLAGGNVSSGVIAPGQAFLILRRSASSFNWTSPRPYSTPLIGP